MRWQYSAGNTALAIQRWQYSARNTALATQPCPRNLYVSIQPRHAMVRNRTCPRNLYVSIQPRQAIQPCVPEASRQGHINLRVYQSACINLRVYQSACVSICVRRSLLKTCTCSLLGSKLLPASPGIAGHTSLQRKTMILLRILSHIPLCLHSTLLQRERLHQSSSCLVPVLPSRTHAGV